MKIKPLPLRHILNHYVVLEDVLYKIDKRIVGAVSLVSPPNLKRRTVSVKGKSYQLSRVVYAVTHRVDPGEKFVDHRNGNPLDDRPSNLRLVTNAENQQNIHPRPDSGVEGVTFSAGRGKKPWQARIKSKHLGYFETPEEAAAGQRIALLLIAEGWKLKRA